MTDSAAAPRPPVVSSKQSSVSSKQTYPNTLVDLDHLLTPRVRAAITALVQLDKEDADLALLRRRFDGTNAAAATTLTTVEALALVRAQATHCPTQPRLTEVVAATRQLDTPVAEVVEQTDAFKARITRLRALRDVASYPSPTTRHDVPVRETLHGIASGTNMIAMMFTGFVLFWFIARTSRTNEEEEEEEEDDTMPVIAGLVGLILAMLLESCLLLLRERRSSRSEEEKKKKKMETKTERRPTAKPLAVPTTTDAPPARPTSPPVVATHGLRRRRRKKA